MTKPTVIAHRGFSAIAPENTLPAFQNAIDAGADMIEFDIRLTRDQQFVVIHDATLERTTNGRGIVENHTLSELQTLDAGSWFGREFAGTVLPSLGETLSLCRNRILVNIEVKTEIQDDLCLDQLADLVGMSTGKGTLDMTKEFGFQKCLGNRATGDLDKRGITSR